MLLKEPKLDPRIQRTRELLQQALADLMREKDFDQITVQDIAAKARVNRATFYDHFDDKYALLNVLIQESLLDALERKLPGTPAFTLENLRQLALVLCELLSASLGHCDVPSQSTYKPLIMIRLQSSVEEVLTGWLKTSRYNNAQPDIDGVASMTSWVIFGIAVEAAQLSRAKKRVSAEQKVDEILPLLASGLGTLFTEQ